MKFHLKAKYHIHFNLHVVKWSDKDGPPYPTTMDRIYTCPAETTKKCMETSSASTDKLFYSYYNGPRGRIERHSSYFIHYFDLICYMIIYQRKCVLQIKRN